MIIACRWWMEEVRIEMESCGTLCRLNINKKVSGHLPENDVISFNWKNFCALGLRLKLQLGLELSLGLRLVLAERRLNTFSIKRPFGQLSYIPIKSAKNNTYQSQKVYFAVSTTRNTINKRALFIISRILYNKMRKRYQRSNNVHTVLNSVKDSVNQKLQHDSYWN